MRCTGATGARYATLAISFGPTIVAIWTPSTTTTSSLSERQQVLHFLFFTQHTIVIVAATRAMTTTKRTPAAPIPTAASPVVNDLRSAACSALA